MSVFDSHHNNPALISSSRVLPSGCPMLSDMLDAQPDGERSIHFQTLFFFPPKARILQRTHNQAVTHSQKGFYIRNLTQTTKSCDGQSPQFWTYSIIFHLWWCGRCISLKLRLKPKCYTPLGPHAFYTSKPACIPWFDVANSTYYEAPRCVTFSLLLPLS